MEKTLNRHEKSLIYALTVMKEPKYKQYINAIYLYGSCARRTYTYSSDVDLFLFVDKSTPEEIRRQLKIEVVPKDYTLPDVEIKMSDGDKFSDSRQFEKNLRKDAVLLWERKQDT